MKQKEKKIIFIANGFGLSPVLSGGEVRLFNLLKYIKNYFIPVLITTSGGTTAIKNYLKTVNFDIKTVKCSFILKKEFFSIQRLTGYFISAFHTFLLLRKINFNAIYTSSDAICDILPAFFIKIFKNKKWFVMLHHKYLSPFKRPGNFFKNLFLFFLQNFSFTLIAKKSDFVFILDTEEGEQIKKTLIKKGFNGEFFKTRNGIDIDNNILQKKFKKEKNMALYVGGLRPGKGLYDIIPVWEKVIDKNEDLKLYIIGMGSEKSMKYLKNEIKKKNLTQNIYMMGFIPDSKLKKFYEKSLVFFLPSHEEGWGISILEALKYKCIPVVYDLPAFKIFKNHIISVPCFDVKIFSEKILNIFSGKLKFKIKNNFLNSFAWDKIMKKDINILKNNF